MPKKLIIPENLPTLAQTYQTAAEKKVLSLLSGDWRLVTADITYHMPDHPAVLQTFLWQQHDNAPRYPMLGGFLRFWQENLDGALHSVRVGQAFLLKPREIVAASFEGALRLH